MKRSSVRILRIIAGIEELNDSIGSADIYCGCRVVTLIDISQYSRATVYAAIRELSDNNLIERVNPNNRTAMFQLTVEGYFHDQEYCRAFIGRGL